jgi:hypothetical protein
MLPAAHRIARAATGHSPLAVNADNRSGLPASWPTSLLRRTVVRPRQLGSQERETVISSGRCRSVIVDSADRTSSPAAGLYELESPNLQNRAGYSCLCCTRHAAPLNVSRKLYLGLLRVERKRLRHVSPVAGGCRDFSRLTFTLLSTVGRRLIMCIAASVAASVAAGNDGLYL